MSPAKTVVLIVIAIVGQLIIARYMTGLRSLDLILIATIYVSLERNPARALWVGAGAGLLQDSFSGGLIGVNSFAKTVIGFSTSTLSIRVALDSFLPRLIVMATAAALNGLIYLGLHHLFGQPLVSAPVLPQLGRRLGWVVLINTAAALLFFRLLDYWLVVRERTRAPGKPLKRRY